MDDMRSKLIKYILVMCFIVTSLMLMKTSSQAVQLINQTQLNQYDSSNNVLTLESLYIQLLPEFDKPKNWEKDKPNVLVSFSGDFLNNSTIEFQEYIYIPVPMDGDMFTLSMVSETQKGMISTPYELIDGYVRWRPSQPIGSGDRYSFTVEYHFNPIFVHGSGVNEFAFTYTTGFKVPVVNIDIYLPQNTSDPVFIPTPQDHLVINNGIKVYSYSYYKVDYNQSIELNVSYTRTSLNNASVIKEKPANASFYTPLHYDYIGIIIFALILLIIGLSVIALSSKSKTRSTDYVDNGRDRDDNIIDEIQLRKIELRKLLIQGKINEETYKSLLDEEHANK